MTRIDSLPSLTSLKPPASASLRMSWIDRQARRLVLRALSRFNIGELVVHEGPRTFRFGPGGALTARLTINDPRFYRTIATGGSLGAGESFIAGHWHADDLTSLVRLFIQNAPALSGLDSGLGRLTTPLHKLFHARRRNTRRGSRANIAAHYDLSNDFYRTFLDETMTYSCGIFPTTDASLYEASVAKLDRICRKLALSPRDHLLEIGTGWGSLALHAARYYGCHVTTTTISEQQYQLARERINAAGLGDQITLCKADYRDLRGRFDKLISIEMIEAVGHQYYPTFFRQCARLLKPHGLMCLQAITVADRFYDHARRSVDFIKRYVFPGSCIPSINALNSAATRASDLTMLHLEDLTPHYATTLARWRERFYDNLDQVRALGYTDSFIRLWDFYLSYCEAGFHERTIGNVQMMYARPDYRGHAPLPANQALT